MPDATQELLRTEFWVIHLGSDQDYLGRSIVSALRHVGSLSDLTEPEWTDLHAVIRKFETTVRGEFGADLYNWTCLMNNAFKEQNPRPHVHWHVRPRYANQVTIGEQTFTDPNFAHHYDSKVKRELSPQQLQVIVTTLRDAMHAN